MSRGKYSPWCYRNADVSDYTFNCYGEVPAERYNETYDEKAMFGNYDIEGFDSYGYSAFDIDGNYVGIGSGIDRYGRTEYEYLCMGDGEFEHIEYDLVAMKSFVRNR